MRLIPRIPVIALIVSSSFTSLTALAAPETTPKKTVAQKAPKKKKAPTAPPVAPAPVDVRPGGDDKREEEGPAPAPTSKPAAEPAPTIAAAAPKAATAKDAPSESPPSSDDPPRPISIAPVLGYATNGANFGVGARGGYTIDKRFYIGGTFVYHVGSSTTIPSFAGGTMETSVSLFYPGVEAGYDIAAGPVIIRPYAGVGALFVASSSKGGGEEASDTKSTVALWPGCTLTYDIPKTSGIFVGGDTRLLIATSGGDPSLGIFATGGLRF